MVSQRQVGPDFDESYSDWLDRCTSEEGLDEETCALIWDEVTMVRGGANGIERRSAQLEVRAKGRRLEGYAALFDVEARIGDFTETVAPGAFKASLFTARKGCDIVALVDHDPARVLARTKSKTLRLAEDTRGLAFDLDVPATTAGGDVLALAERGDLGGMSFGFLVGKDGDHWDGSKRTLRAVDLKEISVVSAWPAYEGTVVNARMKARDNVTGFRLALARRFLETL
jgi:HK97 family phage prohead protease